MYTNANDVWSIIFHAVSPPPLPYSLLRRICRNDMDVRDAVVAQLENLLSMARQSEFFATHEVSFV